MLPLEGSSDLDTFVRECDARGGIGSAEAAAVIAEFRFDVDRSALEGLDPLSEEYLRFQLELYRLIAGRQLNQVETEHTSFDMDFHIAGTNPYTNISPAMASTHLIRLLTLIKAANPPYGARVLDLGAGWGLSSEICAYTGCNVTAVDINPQFVDLIRRRADRSRLPIQSVAASFENFEADHEYYDMVMFYECLHHAVAPWVVIDRVSTMLKRGGCIGLVNEPINDYWWEHWGLRLDALSIYCIRKFGWFESGWSMPFLTYCLSRAGFNAEIVDCALGAIVIGRKT